MPGQRHVLILLPKSPELAVEILMRSERANRLPVGNPVEESFVPSVWTPPLRRAIARLQPGQRILINADTLKTLTSLRSARLRSARQPADRQRPARGLDPSSRSPGRFDLRPVGQGDAGFIVAELVRR